MVSRGNTPQLLWLSSRLLCAALRYKGAGPFGSFLTTAISGVRNSRCSRSDMNLPSDLFQKRGNHPRNDQRSRHCWHQQRDTRNSNTGGITIERLSRHKRLETAASRLDRAQPHSFTVPPSTRKRELVSYYETMHFVPFQSGPYTQCLNVSMIVL